MEVRTERSHIKDGHFTDPFLAYHRFENQVPMSHSEVFGHIIDPSRSICDLS